MQRTEAVGACDQFGRFGLGKVIVQPGCGARFSNDGSPTDKGNDPNKDINADGFLQGACSRFQQNAVVLDRELSA